MPPSASQIQKHILHNAGGQFRDQSVEPIGDTIFTRSSIRGMHYGINALGE